LGKKTIFGKNYLVKNTGIIGFFRGCGVLSGFVLDAVVLAYFGLGKETDALFVALAIPFLIVYALEAQAPKVLVPVLTTSVSEDGQQSSYRMISNFININIIVLSFIAILGILSAKILIPFQVPGLPKDVINLSVSLNILFFALIPIRGIGAIFQSILYHSHHYLVTSSTRFVSSTVTICAVFLLYKQLGILAVAIGYLIGGMLQLIICIIASSFMGFHYKFILKFGDPKIKRIFNLFIYPLSDQFVSHSRVLIENFLASFLLPGSVSVLGYAFRITGSVSGILLGGVVTSTLPLVSHYAAEKNFKEMKETMLKGFKLVTFIALPLCAWLIFISKPMLVLLFERGEFTRANVTMLSTIIALMVPYILLTRLIDITQNAFYGVLEMKKPFISGVVFIFVNTVFALLLLKILGIYGFPIAASIGSLFAAVYMFTMTIRRFGMIEWNKLKSFFVNITGATVLTGLGFFLSLRFVNTLFSEKIIGKIIAGSIPTLLGVMIFLLAAIILGVFTWGNIVNLLRGDKTL
jgi:putative peptidoglycan lipid II flippase